MELEPMSIDDIIANWKANCGEVKTSSTGTTYLVVPIADRRGHFLNLIQALHSYGYPKEEIKSASLSTKIAKVCWSDLITKMSPKEVRKARDISRHQWEEAIVEFFAIELPKYEAARKVSAPSPAKKEAKEKVLEIDPKDRIKSDVSDLPEIPFDDEILAEIAAVEAELNG